LSGVSVSTVSRVFNGYKDVSAATRQRVLDTARELLGPEGAHQASNPMMGAEDFSYMLNARPGAFIWIGNGDSAGLHNPGYNFNDDAIPFGTSYWVKLVETALAA